MFGKMWSSWVIVLVCFVVAFSGCTRIEPGHVGIKISMSGSQKGVSDMPLLTGWTFYLPGATKVFEYPTYMQTAQLAAATHDGRKQNDEISFSDKDQMLINADVNLSYTIDASKVPAFYIKFRNDDIGLFTYGYLRNVIRDAFNLVTPRFSYEEINGPKREMVLTTVRDAINTDVSKYGVKIEQFGFIGALRPPQAISEAIGLKIKAIQKAQQSENELRQANADAAKVVATA